MLLACFVMVWCFVGYIGEFEYVDDHRAGKIVVELNGRLNKCGVISPRFDVGVKEIEGWTARLLPSRQVTLKPNPDQSHLCLCLPYSYLFNSLQYITKHEYCVNLKKLQLSSVYFSPKKITFN